MSIKRAGLALAASGIMFFASGCKGESPSTPDTGRPSKPVAERIVTPEKPEAKPQADVELPPGLKTINQRFQSCLERMATEEPTDGNDRYSRSLQYGQNPNPNCKVSWKVGPEGETTEVTVSDAEPIGTDGDAFNTKYASFALRGGRPFGGAMGNRSFDATGKTTLAQTISNPPVILKSAGHNVSSLDGAGSCSATEKYGEKWQPTPWETCATLNKSVWGKVMKMLAIAQEHWRAARQNDPGQ